MLTKSKGQVRTCVTFKENTAKYLDLLQHVIPKRNPTPLCCDMISCHELEIEMIQKCNVLRPLIPLKRKYIQC